MLTHSVVRYCGIYIPPFRLVSLINRVGILSLLFLSDNPVITI